MRNNGGYDEMAANGSCAPTDAERDAAIAAIVEAACPSRPRPLDALFAAVRACTPRMLLFGVEEGVFLAALVAVVGLVPAVWAAQQPERVAVAVFVVSPLFYASLQGLCAWRDIESGTLTWRLACRVTPAELGAVRMLVFGAASVAACVPTACVLWLVSVRAASLGWLMSVACASAMVYAAMSLSLLRLRSRAVTWMPVRALLRFAGPSSAHTLDYAAIALPPTVWTALSIVFASIPGAGTVALGVPAAVFTLVALGAAVVFVRQVGCLAAAPAIFACEGRWQS